MRLRRIASVAFLAICAAVPSGNNARAAGERAWISIFPGGTESVLRVEGASIWMRDPGFIIGTAPVDAMERLSVQGVTPLAEIPDKGQWMYLLHHRVERTPPQAPTAAVYALGPQTLLYLFPGDRKVDLPRVKPDGAFQAIPRTPLPPLVTHPADLAPARAAVSVANPLVTQILASTSQASWFQFVRDLSGDNPVTIGGQTWTISTRYSDAMFPTPQANAHATEYLEDRGAGWGYSGRRETYTSTDSGCGSQGQPWQNLIFIVPGQVDYGTHQQVLFVNHYDTISDQSLVYAPGADDAISGGAALLEAMRLFKDYAFKNTIVFAWFSGEEVGVCGSSAYTRQHPVADMWRVVNMDQTAFDGDGNRLMDVYNWDALNSPGSVALGDAFVQANADYGNIIPPENIVRDESKMCATDHCPFWNAGVPAIALLEDLHNHDICPCFDDRQNSGCHDTVTQLWNGRLMFTQDYSWPTEKAAIALIAHLAEPLYNCPAAPVAAPTLTPGNETITVSWPPAAGVTNYVVERARSCGHPFTGIASVNGTTFEDTGVTNGLTTAYRVRTCPTQVSPCVTGAAAAGPSVEYQEGSAAVVADSGDQDGVADNCELSTVTLNLRNDGNTPLTNVRLSSVTSSNPAVRVASALPQLVGALGVGASAPVSFKFYLGRDGASVACGDPLTFTLTTTSDQSPTATRTFTINGERTTVAGPFTWGFESDFDDWNVVSGVVSRLEGGAPGSTGSSLHFRNAMYNDCNAVQSPLIKPSASSTLSMYVNYGISANSDRANLRVVDAQTGEKTLLTPSSGAGYNTLYGDLLLCDGIGPLRGWSGNFTTWRQSTFDLAAYAGKEIRLEARYSSDQSGSPLPQGFWMDLVQLTNATQINCDAQPDSCAPLPPEVSPPGDPVAFTLGKSGSDLALVFSESAGAASYNVYRGSIASLRQGIYDHAQAVGLCGIIDGISGDGAVTVTVPGDSVPADSYLLAVARNGAGESRYGTKTGGGELPLALNACP